MNRVSVVKDMKVNSVSQASILQVGDNELIKPVSKALAVQRKVPDFKGDEGNFDDFGIFSRELPLPPTENEAVKMLIDNGSSRIQVGGIFIYGIAAASVFQVGNNKKIQAESRIKQIRQNINGE
ncbi:spore germination protein GerPE [Paenibacillus sp. LMG 31456]|uniref:Spore germination protein GerPE n=1 Tax=Paenibacillus foliorum TaxID=2654974 RepID=A0A972K0Y1_9BACL|nr:spore germination protein GerPE [Paenibacillus foliorum]NOU93338.1 spore germination protein GerPE [Paenibacillus foliorum]